MVTYRQILLLSTLFALGFWTLVVGPECLAKDSSEPSVGKRVDEKPVYPLSIEGPEPEPITPPTAAEITQSIKRGVDFLLETQLKSGAWGRSGSSKYYTIWAPVPGAHHAYRLGTTALAVMALVEASPLFSGAEQEKIEASIERAQAWLLEQGSDLRRSAPDMYDDYFGHALYNVWGHAYGIQAAVALHDRAEGDTTLQAKLKKFIDYHIHRLEQDSFINGGWGYYDDPFTDKYGNAVQPRRAKQERPTGSSISFTTATVLIALKEAERLGFEIPEKLTKPAVDSILRQRYPDFAYAYGEYLKYAPRMDINRPAGSLGRSQVCNLALRLYGDKLVTDEVLETWLDRLVVRNGWLSMSRKRNYPAQSPHFADFGVAGYFYYYGHYYAAMCIDELPADKRPFYQDHLANILLPLQEKDGSWWDYILYDYHQQYGTAMAVSALVRTLHDEPAAGG
ncbi:MAG: hypothetical protein SH868_06260 [Bythopirellula sp.]|nr:hypothetical protein [Bythopirellula sp.]